MSLTTLLTHLWETCKNTLMHRGIGCSNETQLIPSISFCLNIWFVNIIYPGRHKFLCLPHVLSRQLLSLEFRIIFMQHPKAICLEKLGMLFTVNGVKIKKRHSGTLNIGHWIKTSASLIQFGLWLVLVLCLIRPLYETQAHIKACV